MWLGFAVRHVLLVKCCHRDRRSSREPSSPLNQAAEPPRLSRESAKPTRRRPPSKKSEPKEKPKSLLPPLQAADKPADKDEARSSTCRQLICAILNPANEDILHDPIFDSLSPAQLSQICKLMSFDPVISSQPFKLLGSLSDTDSLTWLENNSRAVEKEICRLGSWSFGEDKSYGEIVRESSQEDGCVASQSGPLEQVERALIVKIWR